MARKTVTEDFEIFPKRLSILMKERKLKQQDLAEFLSVKRQTVSLYMTGQSMPDAEQLRNIAIFFNVSSDWLIGLTGDRSVQIRAVDMLGISSSALDGLLEASKAFPDILSDIFSHPGFFGLVAAICRLKAGVYTAKRAHEVVHEKGLRENFDSVNVLKSFEKYLEEYLGYPISFVEPRHALYGYLDDVKILAENIAKEISGYNNLSSAELMDHIYDFEPREIEDFAKYMNDLYGKQESK